MIYRGHIKNGVVLLDDTPNLPDGTEVTVQPVVASQGDIVKETPPPLHERLNAFIGSAQGLPPNASQHVDELLYGQDEA